MEKWLLEISASSESKKLSDTPNYGSKESSPYGLLNAALFCDAFPKMNPIKYSFIVVHDEEILDAIEPAVKGHPEVIDSFQDTGNWYSNGETGPEWFSMHVYCREDDSDRVKEFVREELRKLNAYHDDIKFTGKYSS